MKPIIFNTTDVKAILSGAKTQTRRAIKPQPKYKNVVFQYGRLVEYSMIGSCWNEMAWHNPPYKKGDALYVREAWADVRILPSSKHSHYLYEASHPNPNSRPIHWRPSVHMPREAARIFLRVTDIRVERLQKISSTDMWNEGCLPHDINQSELTTHRECLEKYWIPLWNSLNAKRGYGWDSNPWIWVISFERIEKP